MLLMVLGCLIGPFREQARSYRICVWAYICADCQGPFAGKPAPTGFVSDHYLVINTNPVGAGLPAKGPEPRTYNAQAGRA
ncbi:hypothetical protein ELQ88_07075 [Pseudomonas sp. MPC6]|nr:hypothetical protein ELQ88_07075 [Pseudomonas sp. MPC6]